VVSSPDVLAARTAALRAGVARLGSVLVAFSGGADSALVLAVAAEVLGPGRTVAATAVSPSLPSAELAAARAFADGLGVEHLLPGTAELDRPGYVANAGDRVFARLDPAQAHFFDTKSGNSLGVRL